MAVREHGLFRRLDHPAVDAAKGGCYIYGDAGPCIDTGVLVEFEGTLTISLGALREMAEVAGFSINEEGIELERRNAELEKSLAEITLERDALLDTLSGLEVAKQNARQRKAAIK